MLRRKVVLTVLFAVLLMVAQNVEASSEEKCSPETHGQQTGTLLYAKDGDSLMVNVNGEAMHIRLIGMDCPEKGQEWGDKAEQFTRKFCAGAKLTLQYDRQRTDRFGRILAYVWTAKGMLNKKLVEHGLAVTMPIRPNLRYSRQLKQLEQKARAAQIGFWGQGGLSMPPWKWRKKHPGNHSQSNKKGRSDRSGLDPQSCNRDQPNISGHVI